MSRFIYFFLDSCIDHLPVLCLKVSKFALLACALIFVQKNYTPYIKELREYLLYTLQKKAIYEYLIETPH
jgi:hypothetical protein